MTATVRPRAKTARPLAGKRAESAPTLEFKAFTTTHLLTKAEDLEATPGVVEALVAVTGNTDDGNDVIQPGAFHFKRAPKVVWSHDLKVLVGKVLVYEEWKPGDARLPADLKAAGLGALYFKMAFDLEDPESFKAYRKVVFHEDLGWSIGYEVDPKGFKMLGDGRRSLTKVYVWEGSPTTFGMNKEARTLSAKSLIHAAVDGLGPGISEEKAAAFKAALEDLFQEASGEREEKAWVPLAGSFEETRDRLSVAINNWAVALYGERDAENDWWVSVEGTFDDNVVATVRVYAGDAETASYRFPYTEGPDGTIDLGEAEEVEVLATVAPVGTGTGPVSEPVEDDEDVEEKSLTPAQVAEIIAAQAVVNEMAEETKAGRVLSEANASKLQAALETIQTVLAAAAPKDKKDEKTVLQRAIVPKGQGGTIEAKAKPAPVVAEGMVALDAKDLLEMELLS